MSNTETVLLIAAVVVIALVCGNIVFQFIAERRNPPIGRLAQSDGVRLHYIERGDPGASCVVLFHGNGSLIQDFTISGLIDLLATHNRVICFDRPGFGYSQRPRFRLWTAAAQAALFRKALDDLHVRNPVVLGHSWGTLVAIALALRNDYPIRGLVLASGYYFPTARWDTWLMSGPAIPIIGDLIRYTVAPIVGWAMLPGLLRTLFSPRPVPQIFRNEFPISLMLRPKQLRAAAEESALLIPEAARLQRQYAKLACPVRIFHGTADRVIEPDQSQHLDKVLQRSVLHLVDHAGHMVTYADVRQIAEAVAALE